MSLSSNYNEMLIGPALGRCHADSQSCCGFMSTMPCHIQKTAFHSSPSHLLALLLFSPPPHAPCSLDFQEGDRDIPLRDRHSAITYSQHLEQLCLCIVITCCRQHLLEPRLIHQQFKDINLNIQKVSCLFSKATGLGPSQGLCSPQPWAFDQVFSTRHEFPPVEGASNLIRNWSITP